MLLVQIVRVPAAGLEAFQRFELRVLPLMARYGGRLERRLRDASGETEIHIISFPSADALEQYRDSPERAEHLPLLVESGATSELIEVTDVAEE
jgi:hypothetical protein